MEGNIFVTGGTGSLGTALLRRAALEGWNCRFTVYSRDEVKQGQLKARYPQHRYLLGDVRDQEWLAMCMKGHDLVIHAAAYKQIPAAEVNAGEAIKTNILGSMAVARAAVQASVPRVVGISTDKACSPINLYGMTKAAMEKLFQQACCWGDTQFNLVRYGNVLGSRGSVVPFFERQREQGFVTVTDPAMTRFWLTIGEAIDLIEQASQESETGTILVPFAPASTMAVLVEAIAPDAEVRVIGRMAGEKVHECMVNADEAAYTDWESFRLSMPSRSLTCFRIFPAASHHKGNRPDGYEYRSDQAHQLTAYELRCMIARSKEEAGA